MDGGVAGERKKPSRPRLSSISGSMTDNGLLQESMARGAEKDENAESAIRNRCAKYYIKELAYKKMMEDFGMWQSCNPTCVCQKSSNSSIKNSTSSSTKGKCPFHGKFFCPHCLSFKASVCGVAACKRKIEIGDTGTQTPTLSAFHLIRPVPAGYDEKKEEKLLALSKVSVTASSKQLQNRVIARLPQQEMIVRDIGLVTDETSNQHAALGMYSAQKLQAALRGPLHATVYQRVSKSFQPSEQRPYHLQMYEMNKSSSRKTKGPPTFTRIDKNSFISTHVSDSHLSMRSSKPAVSERETSRWLDSTTLNQLIH